MKIAITFVLLCFSMACGASEGSKEPAPVVTAPEETPQGVCIQRIFCYDGSEYCCKTNTCKIASCEPPQWDRVSCTCQ
jgi:hypothetical protein